MNYKLSSYHILFQIIIFITYYFIVIVFQCLDKDKTKYVLT